MKGNQWGSIETALKSHAKDWQYRAVRYDELEIELSCQERGSCMIIAYYSNRAELSIVTELRKLLGLPNTEFITIGNSEKSSFSRRVDGVFLPCTYRCSFENCGVRFYKLRGRYDCPIVIYRPLMAAHPLRNKNGYTLSLLNPRDIEEAEKNVLSRLLDSPSHACCASWAVHPSQPFYKIARAQMIISEECGKRHSLLELSKRIGWSRTWLSHAFRKHVGIGLEQYLLHLNLCFALWQVMASDFSIKQIAYDLGYRDSRYFSNLFRERFGVLPSIARRLNFPPYNAEA
jgi:AraC-like DNA-binding protein